MKEIKILGSGCPKCKMLADQVKAIAEDMQIDYTIEKVTEINDIISYGVMVTPALVIDGQVKAAGKIPSAGKIKELLNKD